MRKLLLITLSVLTYTTTFAQNINTIAGGLGDGRPAISTSIKPGYGTAVDSSGNIYIADAGNNRIRKVNASTGIMSTIAGNGAAAYGGDGNAATSAQLYNPQGVAVDDSGNIFIADYGNNRIRKVTASTGVISTVAGNGTLGFGGDGSSATLAILNSPRGLSVDGSGNIYIADQSNHRIRKVTASTGIISTVAGNGTGGYGGDGNTATSANLNSPRGVAVDGSGNIYIADANNHRIRKVTVSTGFISTVAGNGTGAYGGDGSAATSANLNSPWGVAVDGSGNIYIADASNHRIRKVTVSTGFISTVAGNGTQGYGGDGSAATLANLRAPSGLAVDVSGNIYISELSNLRIRKVTVSTGIINTIAGNGTASYGGDGSAAIMANLFAPTGVVLDSSGNIYIADFQNHRIRKVTVSTGIISTVAGNGAAAYGGDGSAATSANLSLPYGVTVDDSGSIYIADQLNNRIRKVTASNGIISTVAGNGTQGYGGDDSAATSANLYDPSGLAVDGLGNIYIADAGNQRIRKVTASTGIISTVAGNGTGGYGGDGSAATSANLNNPKGVAVDGSGNIYIADYNNNRIRKVTASTGVINTVAGNGTGGYSGDGSVATSANLYGPSGVAIDVSGNIYIADLINNRIRKVTASSGIISSVAGSLTGGYGGDGSAATSANLNYPTGLAVDGSGNIYIADYGNSRIRKVNFSNANNIITNSQTICAGSAPANLNGSTPIGGTGSFTYTWLSSTTSETTGFMAIPSTNTINYSPGALTQSKWFRRYVVSGTFTDTSAAVAITVNNAIATNTITGATQTICSGSIPAPITATTVTGGNGTTYTYKWLKSTTSATTGFVNAGGNDATQNFTSGALTQNTWFKRKVLSGVCNADTTVALMVTVNTAIANNTITGATQTICSGTIPAPITATTASGGNGISYTYKWLKSTTSASIGYVNAGGNDSIQTFTSNALTQNTWFKRIVSSGVCNADTTAALLVTVNTAIANNTITGTIPTICSGTIPAPIIATTATGGNGTTYNYKWLKSTTSATTGFANAGGNDSIQNFTSNALTQNTWFKRKVISGVCNADTTATLLITVNTAIANNNITSTAPTICSGTIPAPIAATIATGGNGTTYTYKWLKSTTSANTGYAFAGGDDSIQNFTSNALTQNTWFKRMVSSGVCNADTTSVLLITVNTAIANNNITSTAPTICSGSIPAPIGATIATGGNGTTYTYKWLKSITSATTGYANAGGNDSIQNFTSSLLTQNTWFKRKVISGVCNADSTNALMVTVNTAIDSNTITSAVQTICSGSIPEPIAATTATGGNGTTYTYKWLISTTSASTGFANAGGNDSIQNFTSNGLTQNTWFKRKVISGVCNADTTAALLVTINTAIANNTITSTAPTICSGSIPAPITATTATGGNGTTYIYKWLKSTTSATTGFANTGGNDSTQNFTSNALTQNTWFKRIVTSGVCNTDTTVALQVTVNPKPAITNASTASICSGTSTNLTLAATAESIYAWTLGTNIGLITGASESSGSSINQILTNPSDTNAGTIVYNVTPTSTTGSCVGNPTAITVTINPIPATSNISGKANAANLDTASYSVNGLSGSVFNWFVSGATIQSGAGSNQIQVKWLTTGVDTIKVTETSNQGCIGNLKSLFVNVSPTIGMNEFKVNNHVIIYPNPFSETIHITLLNNLKLEKAIIYDLVGNEIIISNKNEINVSNLKSGIYLIVIVDNWGNIYNQKLIKN